MKVKERECDGARTVKRESEGEGGRECAGARTVMERGEWSERVKVKERESEGEGARV